MCPPNLCRAGEIVVLDFLPKPAGSGISHVQFYCPTNDDIALLKSEYPTADPQRPRWLQIETDLTIAGHSTDTLANGKVTTILAWMKQLKEDRPMSSVVAQDSPTEIRKEHLIGFAGISEIMGRFKIDPSKYTAVDGRLKRFRKANTGNGKAFTENDAPGRNTSRYLYNVAMVYPLLRGLSGAPNKRPTE